MENCSRIKELSEWKWERMIYKTWKKYFEDLYKFDTKEGVKINMCVIFMRLEEIIILGRVSNQK